MTTYDVVMVKTEKGEKYILETARVDLIAYRYPWHTRYFARTPNEKRFKRVNAGWLWDNYPVTFSLLRKAVGVRNYMCS